MGGSEFGGETIGFLGQNVLHLADLEYDLGQGMVRLIKPKDCSKTTLAYWATTTMLLSTMPIEPITPQSPHTLEGRLSAHCGSSDCSTAAIQNETSGHWALLRL